MSEEAAPVSEEAAPVSEEAAPEEAAPEEAAPAEAAPEKAAPEEAAPEEAAPCFSSSEANTRAPKLLRNFKFDKNETERGVLCWCAAHLQTIDPRSIDFTLFTCRSPSLTKIPASRCTLDAARMAAR